MPECRMREASATQDFGRRLIDNDVIRSRKRARVNGLVDGNPPYRASSLAAAGRAEACNVNWGTARAYLENSSGAFYDLFSEAPGFFNFQTKHGPPDQRDVWSSIAARHADKVLREDSKWDAYMQKSQKQMVLHGTGPFIFEDEMRVLPKSVLSGDLKAPEFTPSDTADWDAAMLQVTYYPPQLYEFIKNEEAAKKRGWDVEYTKIVIANAMDIRTDVGVQREWEFYQQELKNNSLTYYDDSKVCRVMNVFWREFDGRISHGIVERTTNGSSEVKYLFISIGRYASFDQAVHPMYFDVGTNGNHHEVTGLGVKMFAAMEFENRLICNLCDKAFSPKMIFNPTTTEASQKFSLNKFGDYAVLSGGYQMNQTGVAGLMNDGVAMHSLLTGVMQDNLSTYRGAVPEQKSGNPVTKFEKQLQAAQQAALNKTQYNRYYVQMDKLYQEIWRRLSNPNSTDERAVEFQRRCKNDGVPIEALNRWEYVGATRVPGQGSAFMRKTAVDSLFPIAGSLPEEGWQNLIVDKIAVEAGQYSVQRYFPRKAQTALPDEQQAMAMLWVSAMESGVPAVVTSSQNALTYASTFLKAGMDALKSLQQGGDPMKVLTFLHLVGPAVAAQLNRIKANPTRQDAVKALMQQWQQLGQATDQLQAKLTQQAQQQQAQQTKTANVMSDLQLKQAKVQSDIQLKSQKNQAQIRQSAEKHRMQMAGGVQKLALNDATTASDIHLNRLKLFQSQGDDQD